MDLGPVWCYNCTDETTTRVHDASLALAPPAAAAAATSSVLSAEVSLPPSSSSVHQNRFDIIRVATESVVGVSVDVVPLEAAATAVSEAAAATAVVDTLSSPSESGGSVVISSSSSSSGTTRAVEMGGLVVTATARSSQHFLGWHPESSISCAECSAELGWIMVEHASASERNGDDDDAGEGARAKQRMSFAALQLLRVKQREWSLRDIHGRIGKLPKPRAPPQHVNCATAKGRSCEGACRFSRCSARSIARSSTDTRSKTQFKRSSSRGKRSA